MKNRDSVIGLVLAFACEGAATVKREPTAYSYNGVVLPKLPEWDREKYPYAVIFVGSVSGEYTCVFAKNQSTVTSSGTYSNLWTTYWQLTDGAWVEHSGGAIGGQLVWANYDAYIADNDNYGELSGTLYLSASNPIPVYE